MIEKKRAARCGQVKVLSRKVNQDGSEFASWNRLRCKTLNCDYCREIERAELTNRIIMAGFNYWFDITFDKGKFSNGKGTYDAFISAKKNLIRTKLFDKTEWLMIIEWNEHDEYFHVHGVIRSRKMIKKTDFDQVLTQDKYGFGKPYFEDLKYSSRESGKPLINSIEDISKYIIKRYGEGAPDWFGAKNWFVHSANFFIERKKRGRGKNEIKLTGKSQKTILDELEQEGFEVIKDKHYATKKAKNANDNSGII